MLPHNVDYSGLHREDTLVQPTVPFGHWWANAVFIIWAKYVHNVRGLTIK